MDMDSGLQIDLVGGLRRRLWMIGVITWVTTMIAYVIAMSLPNEYTSAAALFVQPQGISRGLVNVDNAGDDDIANQLNLMSAEILSSPRLSRVIDDLKLFEQESKSMTRQQVIDMMKSRISVQPVLPELQEGIRSKSGAVSNTFHVVYRSHTAAVAAEVAQRIADDFVKEHIAARIDATRRGLEFIEGEEDRIGQQIKLVEVQIAQVKAENTGRLPEDFNSNQGTRGRLTTEIRTVRRMIDSARSDVSYWDGQVASVGMLNSPRDDASPMRRLQILELDLATMRSRGFTDKHPDVIQTLVEIEEVRETITSAEVDDDDDGSSPTVAQQAAEQQRQLAQLKLEQAEAERARLEEQLAQTEARLAESTAVAERIGSLQREILQMSDNLEDMGDRRLAAATAMNLERRQLGKQFRVLEPAVPPQDPSSPNRAVILGMGVLAGFILGVGLAVILEGMDMSFHRPAEVQSALSLPVLASIPSIVLESDLVARKRIWMRRVVVGTVLTVVLLGTGVVSYMVVNGAPGFLRSRESAEPAPERVGQASFIIRIPHGAS